MFHYYCNGIILLTIMAFQVERIFKGPGFAETLYLGTCDGRRIIRKASNPDSHGFSRSALVREIRLLRDLPEELKLCFPELLNTNLGDLEENSPELPGIIYYDMPYYSPGEGWITLSVLLCEGSIDRADAIRVFGEILDTAFTYFRIDERDPSEDYAEKTMLGAIRESLAWASSDDDFRSIFALKDLRLSGRPFYNIHGLAEYFEDSPRMRALLTPRRDRFLHGDFFPENILYNVNTGSWILLDPVSVRGVHRGDFMLDITKMEEWLKGELPALRMGQFTVDIIGNTVDLVIHNRSGKLEHLYRLGLSEWYHDRLREPAYSGLFSREPGWDIRAPFIHAFYALCMLPLADKRQAVARYFLAIRYMADFIEKIENSS